MSLDVATRWDSTLDMLHRVVERWNAAMATVDQYQRLPARARPERANACLKARAMTAAEKILVEGLIGAYCCAAPLHTANSRFSV